MRMNRIRNRLSLVVFVSMLAACGGAQHDATPVTAADASAANTGDATTQVGDAWVRASVVQGSALPATIASRYGVERDPRALLLLVVAGKGPVESSTPVPVDASARVTGLDGSVQDIAMRQVRDGDAIDSIGTLHTTLPDTLRFELHVRVDGKASTFAFQREFYPQ